jgi:V-type H+-transporting ATPase subunit a
MKLSVIIAYLHMGLGLFLMALNHKYNGNRLGILAKFLPQMLFLSCTFGYMDILVIVKWFNTYKNAPSIINSMISMFLGFGSVEDGEEIYAFQ